RGGQGKGPIIVTRLTWYDERSRREHASTEMVLPEFYGLKTRHRICPICEGEGMVTVPSFSRDIPPDADDCPICDGLGRVDQLGWVRATLLNIDEQIADEHFCLTELQYYMSAYSDPFYIHRFGVYDG